MCDYFMNKRRGILLILLSLFSVIFAFWMFAYSIRNENHIDKPRECQDKWRKASPYSVGETLDRLSWFLNSEPGVKIFIRINQQKIVMDNGGEINEVESMFFEKQQLASMLLSKNIEAAVRLPIQATAWKDANGQVWLQVSDICKINHEYHLEGANGAVKAVEGLLSGWIGKVVDVNLKINADH
ncbi:hypothetical protein [Scandinavium goeteborgense]|uniref:hypothetical protein n=1 Tax=Scandinavium goeteborgense TaxID=1851514 RepID=UPI000F67B754|nr:hypothetical protein [Scandinavium goeteborgense]QKN79849.1 hypothetical protein A8O29_000580 [Scandinavium goeteborgense]